MVFKYRVIMLHDNYLAAQNKPWGHFVVCETFPFCFVPLLPRVLSAWGIRKEYNLQSDLINSLFVMNVQ